MSCEIEKHALKVIKIKGSKLESDERQWIYGASQTSLWGQEGTKARQFLQKRGVGPETISSFRLGYVPEKNVSNNISMLSDRISIPIFDAYDNLLALSFRPIVNDPAVLKEYLKYWNESYPKGEHLFGLNLAKMSIIKHGFAILVEGQFDVVSMHAYGLTNTVGVLGGAFTPIQAMLIRRWTDQVVVMFDGDKAGRDHTERCFEVLDAYGYKCNASDSKEKAQDRYLRATVANLRHDTDPNEYLKSNGSREMKRLIHKEMVNAGMTCPAAWLN